MSELSVKLADTLRLMEEARINGIAAQAAAERAKIEEERRELTSRLETIRAKIVSDIEIGKVPLYHINNYHEQTAWREAQAQKAKHQVIWNRFFSFFETQDLAVKLIDEHDGMGMESWINITVEPKHKLTRGL